jgi:hypothetical protein
MRFTCRRWMVWMHQLMSLRLKKKGLGFKQKRVKGLRFTPKHEREFKAFYLLPMPYPPRSNTVMKESMWAAEGGRRRMQS